MHDTPKTINADPFNCWTPLIVAAASKIIDADPFEFALPLMVMTAAIILIGMYILFSPLASVIGLQPLPGIYSARLVGILFCDAVLTQSIKV